MINLYKNFIEHYEVILTIKNKYTYNQNKLDIIKNVIFSTMIISIIFVLTGLLLNVNKNLNYVFYATNTVILGSFVLYRISEEIKFKNKFDLTYNHYVAIIYDSFTLLSIILLANSLLFVIFMRDLIPFVDLIIISLLAITSLIITAYYDNQIVFPVKGQQPKIVKTSLIVFVMYLIVFNILGIKSPTVSYVISSGIVVLFYFEKQYIEKSIQEIPNNKSITVFITFLIAAVFLINNLDTNKQVDDKILTSYSLVSNEPNINEPNSLILNQWARKILYNDEYVFIDIGDYIKVYNQDLVLQNMLEKTDEMASFIIYDNHLAYVTDETEDYERDLVILNIDGSTKSRERIDYFSPYHSSNVFIYERELSYVEHNKIKKVSTVFNYETHQMETEVERLTFERFTPKTILYLSDTLLVFTDHENLYYSESKSGDIYSSKHHYNNNRIIINEEESLVIYDIEYFLEDTMVSEFEINCQDCDVEQFLYQNFKYYIVFNNEQEKMLMIFDKDGSKLNELVIQTDNYAITSSNIFIWDRGNGDIYSLDFENPGSYIFNSKSYIYTKLFFTSVFVIMVTNNFALPSFKRGYLNG